MFIEKIEIRNYRSCKESTFIANEKLNVLIGPNGSGKTSILRSLLLLKSLVREDSMRFRYDSSSGETRVKVSLNLNNKKISHTSDMFVDTSENNEDLIYRSDQKWYMPDFANSRKFFKVPIAMANENGKYYDFIFRDEERIFIPRSFRGNIEFDFLKSKKVMNAINHVSDFYNNIMYYSASQFTNPSNCPVSFEIEQEGKKSRIIEFRGHSKWLFDMYSEHKKETEEFNSFISIVGKGGLGLIDELVFEEIEVSSMDYAVKVGGKLKKQQKSKKLIIPKIKTNGSILSPSQLSEGTFKTLGMLFYIMTGRGSVILLEEPEVCIHHGLLSSIIELIKQHSQNKQVFISTHSDYILDSVENESVFVVNNSPENGTKINQLRKHMAKDDFAALRKFLAEEGNLGEYWRMGGFDE